MTSYFYTSSLTVPAGTPIAAPVSAAVALTDENLDNVRVIIPAGHAALTGFAITWGGTQVVPYGTGTWITGDDEIIDYPWKDEVTAGGLVVTGYNLDIFPHTFYLRWTLTDRAAASPVIIASPQAAATVSDGLEPGNEMTSF